jgi:hypothetical protein
MPRDVQMTRCALTCWLRRRQPVRDLYGFHGLTETEFEVDLLSGTRLRVHRRCYDLWIEKYGSGVCVACGSTNYA